MRCHEKWVESKEKKNISMKYTGKKCLNFDTVSIISLTIKKYWIGSGKWKVRSGDPGKGLSEYVDIPRMKINLYQFQGQKKKKSSIRNGGVFSGIFQCSNYAQGSNNRCENCVFITTEVINIRNCLAKGNKCEVANYYWK